MRHRRKGRKLNRTASHRRALLANLVTALFEHGSIKTTLAKAKEARPLAEKLITLAKRGDLAARRRALRIVKDKSLVYKLFNQLAPKFVDRNGGYTRIVRLGRRMGDGAHIAVLQLVEAKAEEG
ncbi:MAG: 50S ribosomal protein L17 [Candidatus Latescibacterota bacterium]|nr:MAG: 50S ribosomal protein L17 [Candidatus Latescibacterota bacterium]RKY63266.1 MAG: 50S ribosomal protein L17 [Candidatus Latescibacterota bacterium]HDI00457.1 50S ribosomal protein L17 [Bacillota bacterium]